LPMLIQRPLLAATRLQGGCGCDGCDRSTAAKSPGTQGDADAAIEPRFQPITFVRGTQSKKSLR